MTFESILIPHGDFETFGEKCIQSSFKVNGGQNSKHALDQFSVHLNILQCLYVLFKNKKNQRFFIFTVK